MTRAPGYQGGSLSTRAVVLPGTANSLGVNAQTSRSICCCRAFWRHSWGVVRTTTDALTKQRTCQSDRARPQNQYDVRYADTRGFRRCFVGYLAWGNSPSPGEFGWGHSPLRPPPSCFPPAVYSRLRGIAPGTPCQRFQTDQVARCVHSAVTKRIDTKGRLGVLGHGIAKRRPFSSSRMTRRGVVSRSPCLSVVPSASLIRVW